MSEIPDDIMDTARDLARNAGWSTSGDVRDISHALFAERQRSDSLKALCDEMAKALEPFAKLASEFVDEEDFRHKPDDRTVWGFNDHDLSYGDFRRIHSLLAAYRKEKEVGNG
jgi:hypothetical protein